jgi:hypothetical protein
MRKIITYERLHRHVLAWMKRQILRLVVFGPPGGKSRTVKDALGQPKCHFFRGRRAAAQIAIAGRPDRPVMSSGNSVVPVSHQTLCRRACVNRDAKLRVMMVTGS